VAGLAQQALLKAYAPAAVLVTSKHQVVYVHGPTSNYLNQPAGAPTNDVLALVRDGLLSRLRAALYQAAAEQRPIEITDAHVNRDDSYVRVKLTVKPLPDKTASEDLLLVTFEDQDSRPIAKTQSTDETSVSLVEQLEYELKATREELQSHIEEQEAGNEELQAANEEIMSVNEELQSTNEELETSKEELQSLNEELTTVNNQLKDKLEELEATTDDLTNLLISTDIATLFLDTECRIKRFTPACTSLFHLLEADIGRPIVDIRQKFKGEDLLREVERVLNRQMPLECEVRTEKGEWFIRRMVPYRTGEHHIGGVVITFVNISERKRSEEQTRRLAAVMRDSNDAITVQDLDGRIISWNRGAEQMYGWSEHDALTMNIAKTMPEGERKKTLALIKGLTRGQSQQSAETQRLTRDGRTLDVWMTITPLLDEAGRVYAIATTERDITERMQAEEALLEQKAFSNSLVETAQAIVLLLDNNGRVLQVNPYFEQLTGYRAEDVVSQDWFSTFLPENDRATIRTLFDEVMRIGINPGHTNAIVAADGSLHSIEWRAKNMTDSHGNVIGLRNVGHDVTDRIENERALIAAKREAEHANAAKSRFLAAASHDLRQPLQTISLLNEVLARETDNPIALKALETQSDALCVIEGLIGAYLDMSKLEAGIIKPEFTQVCIAELFAQLNSEFAPVAQQRGIKFRISASNVSVRSDAELLRQILENLLGNAIKHTRPPGRVVIGARRRGTRILLQVWDTGSGIPTDQLEAIFEEFHQLENPARDRQKGLGLGLAIAQRLANLLGHQINVRSTLGKGSVFEIEVPRDDERPTAQALAEPPPVDTTASRASETLLLIDDDSGVLDALRLLLESYGYQVMAAGNGAQAMQQVADAEQPPRLIISDYQIPGPENGLEIIGKIRTIVGEDLPAILMTGDTLPERMRDAQLMNCQVLHKPARSDVLLPMLRQLLQ
jgi:two-component system CheB/CheR fusion protein